MDLYTSIFDLIDLRSFSNLWFWIVLGVMWASASYWVLGVPFDMVVRAKRQGGDAMRDLEDMVRINTGRMLMTTRASALWLLGLGCFVLTGLALLGFAYRIEFAQALFLLGFPMSIVALISVSTARHARDIEGDGAQLCRRLTRHRLYVQLTGVVSIFATALWGMYQNLSVSVLGG